MLTSEARRNRAVGGMDTIFSKVVAALSAWNEIRATRRELSRLSDRELADIGLVRADIGRVARGL